MGDPDSASAVRVAGSERTALADLMVDLGPDAPTLCEGWTTRDLAAHLVVRLRRPDAAAGIVIKRLAAHTRRVQDRFAAQDWTRLVGQVRRTPWFIKPFDEQTNKVEYFIHHEDVRRAQPGWQPRDLPHEVSASLWSRGPAQAKLVLRRTPATVTVTAPGFGSATAGRGGPSVELSGPPGELLLFLSGRQEHAQVRLTGPDAIVARMGQARYGV